MPDTSSFAGPIKFVSVSPHGDPEGFQLQDGSFVKTPPHTVLAPELCRVGNDVEGSGELLEGNLQRVFHRASITVNGKPLTSDPFDKASDKTLRETHRRASEARPKSAHPGQRTGKIIALICNPEGQLERLLLEGGISAHVPRECKLKAASLRLGEEVTVSGEVQQFPLGAFVKVSEVKPV